MRTLGVTDHNGGRSRGAGCALELGRPRLLRHDENAHPDGPRLRVAGHGHQPEGCDRQPDPGAPVLRQRERDRRASHAGRRLARDRRGCGGFEVSGSARQGAPDHLLQRLPAGTHDRPVRHPDRRPAPGDRGSRTRDRAHGRSLGSGHESAEPCRAGRRLHRARADAGRAVGSVRGAGAGPGRRGPLRRHGVHGRQQDERDRHPRGARREAVPDQRHGRSRGPSADRRGRRGGHRRRAPAVAHACVPALWLDAPRSADAVERGPRHAADGTRRGLLSRAARSTRRALAPSALVRPA